VRTLFGLGSTEHRGNQPYLTGRVRAAEGGEHFIVLDRAIDRSNLPASEATQRLLTHWRPRHLVVADIGGGLSGRDGLRVGDVVYASYLHYYEVVKETEGGEEVRLLAFAQPSRGPRATLGLLVGTGHVWQDVINVKRPPGDHRQSTLLEGEILAGERLLSDPRSPVVREIAAGYPKVLALDMESGGVARAIYGAQQDDIFTQFTVLRGISDLVDVTDVDNQATRDEWKPYAAFAAAAAALALVRFTPPHGDPPAGISSAVRGYKLAFQQSLRARLPVQRTMFPLELRSAPRGDVPPDPPAAPPERIERDRLVEVLDADRRVVLYGPSGAGKSWALIHVARQVAAGDDPLAVVVDLKAFKPEWIQEIGPSPVGRALVPAIDAILSAATDPISVEDLAALSSDRKVLLLVDGINEVPEVGERMLIAPKRILPPER
jgi:nucleoside phosphorylase